MNELAPRDVMIERALENEDIISKVFDHVRAIYLSTEDGDRAWSEQIRICYCNQPLRGGEEFKDILGQSEVFHGLRITGDVGFLFLLDPAPNSNWAHRCWVATFDLDHQEVRAEPSDFPPQEDLDRRLVPYAAYFRKQGLIKFYPSEDSSRREFSRSRHH